MTKNIKALFIVFVMLALISPSSAIQEIKPEQTQPKPLEDIHDILAWQSIRSPVFSSDGRWFAYRLSPVEGDGEVFIKDTQGEKEYTFPIGEGPRFASGEIAFTKDSRWAAFSLPSPRQIGSPANSEPASPTPSRSTSIWNWSGGATSRAAALHSICCR